MAKPNAAKLVKSNVKRLRETVERLTENVVLVGVPAEKGQRKDDGPNNATLLYIHENGAPASNVPARPTLHPGVEAVRGGIEKGLAAAAKKGLQTGKEASADKDLHAVGLMAVSSVRKQFDDLSPPLKPGTILGRAKARGTGMRKSEKEFKEMIQSGAAPNAAISFFGFKPLVNTGQLRNSINYVIRKKGK